jgi:hypothetical protein
MFTPAGSTILSRLLRPTPRHPCAMNLDVWRSTFTRDIETQTRFYLYEIYVDEDAFRIVHRGTPHYARWQEAAKVCVVEGSHKNTFARPIRLSNTSVG